MATKRISIKPLLLFSTCVLVSGLTWLGLWNRQTHGPNSVPWLANEMSPPTGARVLILGGALLLLLTAVIKLSIALKAKKRK